MGGHLYSRFLGRLWIFDEAHIFLGNEEMSVIYSIVETGNRIAKRSKVPCNIQYNTHPINTTNAEGNRRVLGEGQSLSFSATIDRLLRQLETGIPAVFSVWEHLQWTQLVVSQSILGGTRRIYKSTCHATLIRPNSGKEQKKNYPRLGINLSLIKPNVFMFIVPTLFLSLSCRLF